MIKVSIILPCYNNETFIDASINSVYNQTFTNWECIIVNDGSEDNSISIIEKWIQKDNRFKLIDQENLGPSISRNNGMKLACGEYIYFLDGDDLLAENSLEELLKLENFSADIIYGKTATTLGQNNTIRDYLDYNIETNKVLLNDQKTIFSQIIEKGLNCTAHNRLYKRSFLEKHQISFKEGILHEDELWVFETLFFSNSIIFSDKVTYFYNIDNSSSITKNKTARNVFDYLDILKAIYRNYYLNEKHKKFKEIIALFIVNFQLCIFYHYDQCTIEEQEKVNDEIRKAFREVIIHRTEKVVSNEREKRLFLYYLSSFTSAKRQSYYINLLNLEKTKLESLKLKSLAVYYYAIRLKTISKRYKYFQFI